MPQKKIGLEAVLDTAKDKVKDIADTITGKKFERRCSTCGHVQKITQILSRCSSCGGDVWS